MLLSVMEKSNTCAQWGIVEPHILADILRSTSGVQKVSKQYLFPFVIFFFVKVIVSETVYILFSRHDIFYSVHMLK